MTVPGSSIFQFRQGDHLCVFHRSENALMEVLSPYIADGLRNGERCFCVQRPEIVKRLEYDLRFIGIDVDKARKNGSLAFHSIESVYLPNGKFEPGAMIDLLIDTIEDTRRQGFRGFRSAGDLSWAVEGRDECRQVVGYEAMVEKCFPGKPAIGMCQYPIDSFPPEILASILRLHRQRIVESKDESPLASITVNNDHCVTEIVADKLVIKPKYYYVVEENLHHDVLGWGTAPDFDVANLRAEHIIRRRNIRRLPN
jgi:hypothetical protein